MEKGKFKKIMASLVVLVFLGCLAIYADDERRSSAGSGGGAVVYTTVTYTASTTPTYTCQHGTHSGQYSSNQIYSSGGQWVHVDAQPRTGSTGTTQTSPKSPVQKGDSLQPSAQSGHWETRSTPVYGPLGRYRGSYQTQVWVEDAKPAAAAKTVAAKETATTTAKASAAATSEQQKKANAIAGYIAGTTKPGSAEDKLFWSLGRSADFNTDTNNTPANIRKHAQALGITDARALDAIQTAAVQRQERITAQEQVALRRGQEQLQTIQGIIANMPFGEGGYVRGIHIVQADALGTAFASDTYALYNSPGYIGSIFREQDNTRADWNRSPLALYRYGTPEGATAPTWTKLEGSLDRLMASLDPNKPLVAIARAQNWDSAANDWKAGTTRAVAMTAFTPSDLSPFTRFTERFSMPMERIGNAGPELYGIYIQKAGERAELLLSYSGAGAANVFQADQWGVYQRRADGSGYDRIDQTLPQALTRLGGDKFEMYTARKVVGDNNAFVGDTTWGAATSLSMDFAKLKTDLTRLGVPAEALERILRAN